MDLFQNLANIETLVTGGGDITIGAVAGIECAATACDEAQCLAMLVKGADESLDHLLRRLDAAIEQAQEEGVFTDEINTPGRGA